MRGVAVLGLAAVLTFALAGCGGGGEATDDATVTVPEPLPKVGEGPAAPTSGTPAPAPASTPTPATAPVPEKGEAPAAAAPEVKAEGFGTFKGRVVFAGDPPAAKMLVAKGEKNVKNAEVCAVRGVPSEELLVDPETRGVRDALVYLPRPTAVKPEAEAAARKARVDFDQRGCMFVPHVLAVMTGTTINVKSDDPVGHNVNSLLKGTRFNTNMQPGSNTYSVTPKAAENRPGMVVCDIHPWMKAWWLVSNNPYFAVTNARGEFTIKDVPAGTQRVVVWQESVAPQGYLTPGPGESIVIQADAETTHDFTIQPAQLKK